MAAVQAHSYDPEHQKAAARKMMQVVLAHVLAVQDLLLRRMGHWRRLSEAESAEEVGGARFAGLCCRF